MSHNLKVKVIWKLIDNIYFNNVFLNIFQTYIIKIYLLHSFYIRR